MKRSELIRLSRLADGLEHGSFTPAEILSMLKRANIRGENFYREIEMDSQLIEVWCGSDPFNDMETVHSHTFYEIICCVAGKVQYLLGAACQPVYPGDILIIPPGVSHRRMPFAAERKHSSYTRYGMWVNAAHFAQLTHFFPEITLPRNTPYILRAEQAEAYGLKEYLLRAWGELERDMPLCSAAIYGESILFLTNLCRALHDEPLQKRLPPPHTETELLDRILIFIDANLQKRITLAELENRFFVSKSYISHQFQYKIGVSFYQYVTQRRLIFAKALIEEGKTMEQVGRLSGFSGYSNFYRAFKGEYGITPSDYRAMVRKKDR